MTYPNNLKNWFWDGVKVRELSRGHKTDFSGCLGMDSVFCRRMLRPACKPIVGVALVCIALFSSCMTRHQGGSEEWNVSILDAKANSKVHALQKKIASAEKSILEKREKIESLREELFEEELNAIESKVKALEKGWQSHPHQLATSLRMSASQIFLEERETLHRIIQTGSNISRAQALLDRILWLITQVSNSLSEL